MDARELVKHVGIRLLVAGLGVGLVQAGTLTFYPTDDAAPDQWSGSGFGGAHETGVRNRYGSGAIWEQDSLTRFDLSSIPPGTDIVSATFHLYYFRYWDHNPAGRPLTCYRITSDWD